MSRSEQKGIATSRRAFLKALGAAVAAMAATPLTASVAQARKSSFLLTQQTPPLKLGVLLPQSQLHPQLSQNWLDGLRLGLSQSGGKLHRRPVEFFPVKYGRTPFVGGREAQQFVSNTAVDVLVGVGGSQLAAPLGDLLHQQQRPMLLSNVGANAVRSNREHPLVYFNTLNYWQTTMALGVWAAQHLGKRAAMLASFYESGYDTLYAFRLGFESAGGQIVYTGVTHMPPDGDAAFTPAFAHTKGQQPDLVFGAYSGPEAVDFVRAYRSAGMKMPLVGSGFLVEESLLPGQGRAAVGISSGLAWSPLLPGAENQAFTSAYRTATGKTADAFALLGYETAQLLAHATATTADTRSTAFRTALGQARVVGPRGALTMHPERRSTSSPTYLRTVQPVGVGLGNAVRSKLPSAAIAESAVALRTSLKTGWVNGYLCV